MASWLLWCGNGNPRDRLQSNSSYYFLQYLPFGILLTLIFLRFEFEPQQSISLHRNKNMFTVLWSTKGNKGNVICGCLRKPILQSILPSYTQGSGWTYDTGIVAFSINPRIFYMLKFFPKTKQLRLSKRNHTLYQHQNAILG